MTTDTEGAYYLLPTRSQRFWRWAGFRFHLGRDVAEDKPDAIWHGWMPGHSRDCPLVLAGIEK